MWQGLGSPAISNRMSWQPIVCLIAIQINYYFFLSFSESSPHIQVFILNSFGILLLLPRNSKFELQFFLLSRPFRCLLFPSCLSVRLETSLISTFISPQPRRVYSNKHAMIFQNVSSNRSFPRPAETITRQQRFIKSASARRWEVTSELQNRFEAYPSQVASGDGKQDGGWRLDSGP